MPLLGCSVGGVKQDWVERELDFDAEGTKASATTMGSSGAGVTLQRCPTRRQRARPCVPRQPAIGCTLSPHLRAGHDIGQ